jgi:hypothetical protein
MSLKIYFAKITKLINIFKLLDNISISQIYEVKLSSAYFNKKKSYRVLNLITYFSNEI